MTKFTDLIARLDESLAIRLNDLFRKPNESWFISDSEKAVKFLIEEERFIEALPRYLYSSGCRPLAKHQANAEVNLSIRLISVLAEAV